MHIKVTTDIKDHLIRVGDIFWCYGFIDGGGCMIQSPKTDELIQVTDYEVYKWTTESRG